jgi:D-threonate/D-erythronate kinase
MAGDWLIIADDLTGAADCGIAFAKVGLETVVVWDHGAPAESPPVLSIDTDSRRLPAAAAAEAQRMALVAAYRPGVSVYKKIDSTLRGQPAAELVSQLAWLAGRRGGAAPSAVIAPAFPATGRTSVDGRILVNGRPLEETPLWARDHTYPSARLPDLLAAAGLTTEVVPLALIQRGEAALKDALSDACRRKVTAIVCDAAGEADLATIAAASLPLADQVMWVGSGGLAGHLARLVSRGQTGQHPPLPAPGPVLVAVGSLAEASRQQADHLVAAGLVEPIMVAAEDLFAGPEGQGWRDIESDLTNALAQGSDLLVEIAPALQPNLSRGPELALQFARMLAPLMPAVGALVATGGDTARALLSQMGVRGIRLLDEVEPGVPLGVTIGPRGLPLISKAGAFGDARTLARCLYRLKNLKK